MDAYKDGLTISEDDYKWLDFSVDKTCQALLETGKQFEKLFATYLVLRRVARRKRTELVAVPSIAHPGFDESVLRTFHLVLALAVEGQPV